MFISKNLQYLIKIHNKYYAVIYKFLEILHLRAFCK